MCIRLLPIKTKFFSKDDFSICQSIYHIILARLLWPLSVYTILNVFSPIIISLIEALRLIKNLQYKGFLEGNLKPSLRKFYGRNNDLVKRYGISVLQMTIDMCRLWLSRSGPLSFMIYHRVCNKSNTMGATSWAGNTYLPEHMSSPPFLVRSALLNFLFSV